MIFYFYLVCFTFSISHSELPFHLVCFPISPSLLFFCFDVHLKHSRKGFVCVCIYIRMCIYIYTMYNVGLFWKIYTYHKLDFFPLAELIWSLENTGCEVSFSRNWTIGVRLQISFLWGSQSFCYGDYIFKREQVSIPVASDTKFPLIKLY